MAAAKSAKLYEEIAAQILSKIQTGALRPGDRLPPERTLAEEFNVSRTAIREALRSLEMMGCVESHIGEGTFIKSPSISNIVDPFSMVFAQDRQTCAELIEVRLIIETEVAALAAKRRSEEQLAAMAQTLLDMQADIDTGGMGIKADEDFHRWLSEAAGNRALRTMLEMCEGMLSRTRPVTQCIKGVPAMSLKDHAAIYEAVRLGDEKAARRLMRRHLNRVMRSLNKVKQENSKM